MYFYSLKHVFKQGFLHTKNKCQTDLPIGNFSTMLNLQTNLNVLDISMMKKKESKLRFSVLYYAARANCPIPTISVISK